MTPPGGLKDEVPGVSGTEEEGRNQGKNFILVGGVGWIG